jgi:hypothetical protein
MSWNTRIVAALVAACASAVNPAPSYAQQLSSFESSNYPSHYIRHRLSLGYIDRVVARDSLARRDATFRVVPGLAGRCSSFESVNYPGHFLRHQGFRLKLARRAEDDLYKADATFCIRAGIYGSGGRSFESANFPGHFIRHTNFELWIARHDGSTLFRRDATFVQRPALTTHAPSVPLGEPELVPAEPE